MKGNKTSGRFAPMTLTRREMVKLSGSTIGGLALGGLALGGVTGCNGDDKAGAAAAADPAQQNSYFDSLPEYYPGEESLGPDEMRITFLGSWFCPRLAQMCNSIFVEVGGPDGVPLDQFVFDCGSGIMGKYNALGIPLSRMDKIFLTHLHADHMSDLTHIYCFGPSYDRKTPLYVWGPGDSGVPDPVTGEVYRDGTKAYCELLRQALRWHTESFSFQSTAISGYTPPSWAPGDKKDAYDLVPFELDWRNEGLVEDDNVAYEANGVKITHFPAVHTRQGSISYKLEWKGLSMIFTGDTRPNNYLVRQAMNGVGVLISEITTTAEVWAEKFLGIPPDPGNPSWDMTVEDLQNVQDSSHTPQKALGYILSQLAVPPRLAVGTHFPATDDTISAALADIRLWYPNGEVAVASDFMVINVTKNSIQQRRAVVSNYSWAPISTELTGKTFDAPKYADPLAQLDPDADIIDPEAWEAR